MVWIVLYGTIAIVVAAAAFVAAEWLRTPTVPAPDRPASVAVAAGLLWPVLIAGLVQLGVFAFVRARLLDDDPSTAPRPVRVPHPVAH